MDDEGRAAAPVLHLLCGKIASGKSTLTAALGAAPATVVLAEDAWLSALYGDEMRSLADYARCTVRLRQAMGPHIVAMLGAGLSVVLDFQANTLEVRQWMRGMIDASGAAHVLHVLDVPDEVCLARLQARNAAGEHPFKVSAAQYWAVTRHFLPPSPEEGFNVVVHRDGAE